MATITTINKIELTENDILSAIGLGSTTENYHILKLIKQGTKVLLNILKNDSAPIAYENISMSEENFCIRVFDDQSMAIPDKYSIIDITDTPTLSIIYYNEP